MEKCFICQKVKPEGELLKMCSLIKHKTYAFVCLQCLDFISEKYQDIQPEIKYSHHYRDFVMKDFLLSVRRIMQHES